MAFEQKPNTGAIFANDNKKGENDPDGKGSALIDGVEYWVSSWVSKTNNGKPFRKLAFTRKQQQSGGSSSQQTRQSSPPADDEVGF